jgi:hypothetical protein
MLAGPPQTNLLQLRVVRFGAIARNDKKLSGGSSTAGRRQNMTRYYVISSALLCLLLAFGTPGFAQQDDHPAQAEEKQDQQEQKPAQEEKENKKQKDEQSDKATTEKKDEQSEKDMHQDQKHEKQASEGGHIPDDKFRAHFGASHTFVINHPVIVQGTPRFQYGGYWFVIASPWPAGWAYTDAVYVDYIEGGYFLLCPAHPGIQVSINVIL